MTLARLLLELLDSLGMIMTLIFFFAILVIMMEWVWRNIKKGAKFIYRVLKSALTATELIETKT